ncbi:MAG: SRPBCC family protein [Planctomycetota bacterium]|nr:SRPBCC family protein [Planctomycetota bacterium]
MKNEGSVEIDRPIDEVFRLTNEDVAKWSIIVVEDELIDEGSKGVGARFRTVTEDRGNRMEFQGVVTAYDPPHALAITMTGKMFDIAAAYSFEDLGGRTKVTQLSNVTGKGFMKLFFLLCGWMMNKASCDALAKELNSLKKHCETQSGSD